MSEAIYIDGEPLSDYGGQLADWNFGKSLTNSILTGKNYAFPSLLHSEIAQGTLKATIHITGRNTADAHMKASQLVCRLNKTADLQMPDGMLYRSALSKVTQTDYTRWIAELSFEFTAVPHGAYMLIDPYVAGTPIHYDGTAPAGVKIEFDASKDITSLTLKIIKNLETKFGTSVKFSQAAELYRVLISGNQTQDGTGDPSFENVRLIHGVTKITVGRTDYTLPQTLYSLPDGTVDTYDVVSSKGTQSLTVKALDGTENWSRAFKVYDYGGYPVLSIPVSDTIEEGDKQHCICSHMAGLSASNLISSKHIGCAMYGEGGYLFVRLIPEDYGGVTGEDDATLIAALKSWLAHQAAIGTPVTVLYQLAAPQQITGTPIFSAVPADTLISADNGGTITATSGNTTQDIQLVSVPSGSHVSIDGIDGKITQNGVNKFTDTNLVDFPFFDPSGGTYAIQTSEAVSNLKIGYYPAYL